MSSIANCEVVMPDDEKDVIRKKARIYLAKSALGLSRKDATEVEGVIPHWAIVVEFYDYGFWVQIEGVQNSGKLKGCYKKPFHDKPVGKLHKFKDVSVILPFFSAGFPKIHEIEISPNDLYRIAKNHPYNDKQYDILTMRCYEWASEAANIIGEQLKKERPKKIPAK